MQELEVDLEKMRRIVTNGIRNHPCYEAVTALERQETQLGSELYNTDEHTGICHSESRSESQKNKWQTLHCMPLRWNREVLEC